MPVAPPSAQRGKAAVLALVAVAAIALAGGAYYLLAIYLPAQKRGPARAELARWEERLAAARACLLGDAPGSPSTREALAIRELSPDPWTRSTCTQLIGQLARGETEDTGMPAVETAWRDLERAAGDVGNAFLAHVDPMGEPSRDSDPERLPKALDELDAAHAALRRAVDLPPLARPAAPPLPTAELIPLRHRDLPIEELTSWNLPTMGRVVAFGDSGGRGQQLTLGPGAPPEGKTVAGGSLHSVPGAPWGATARVVPVSPEVTVHLVQVGPLDDSGSLPVLAPDQDPRKRKDVIALDGRASVYAAVGTADSGLVVAGSQEVDDAGRLQSHAILIHAERGKLTADRPIAVEELAYAIDPAGRVMVAYREAGKAGEDGEPGENGEPGEGRLRGFVARDGATAKVLDLGSGSPGLACLTAKRGWLARPDGSGDGAPVLSFDVDTGEVTPHDLPRHELLGCTADAALLRQRNTARFLVCAEQCREAALPDARPSRMAALAGGEVVLVALRDRVLGVWREQGPPRFFSTQKAPVAELRLAIGDGKVIDVVAKSGGGMAIIRLPAR